MPNLEDAIFIACDDGWFIGTEGNGDHIFSIKGVDQVADGVMVLAFATLEHLNDALIWINERIRREVGWSYRLL